MDNLPELNPVAWVLYCTDGGIEGPLLHRQMEPVRINSGAWTPLYAHPPAAAERIARLEGLLLRANRCVRMDGDDDLADEIEAALKGK
jgi:hypothetical protein